MSLRPRYSLLTLLVLTALVAGGVKLWYGPHRVVMSDPPTAEEWDLVAWPPRQGDWTRYAGEHVAYEYDYVNEWTERRYLFFKGYSLNKRPIPVGKFAKDEKTICLYPRNVLATPEELAIEAELAKHEQVVCWLSTARNVETGWYEVFFLTSRKKIYYFNVAILDVSYIVLFPVELNDIDDEFRQIVAAELAEIPDPQ